MGQRRFSDRAFVGLQYLLPQHFLSGIVRLVAHSTLRPLKNALIRAFLGRYPVDLAEAARPAIDDYDSFNDFFTRRLRPGARPGDPAPRAVLCPVDGSVSQAGTVADGLLLQAKGLQYGAAELLGGDEALAAEFEGGGFATLYLAPHDYHRIHMPFAGSLRLARFVPGDLFSVNVATAAAVPGLFARNERVACVFDTTAGPMAVVLVGALFVGSMSLAWEGVVRGRRQRDLPAREAAVLLDRGAELGCFNMGSTVIVMFARSGPVLVEGLSPGRAVRVGERLALAP